MAKGKKTGGRQRGSGNKVNRDQELKKAAAEGGQTPLEYMLSVMRDDSVEPASRRDEMAKAAAPYIHSKRATEVELSGQIKMVRVKAPELNG